MSETDNQEAEGPDGSEFPGVLLHQAVKFSNRDLLQDLLSGEERNNLQSTDADGRTVLHKAVEAIDVVCCKLLLEAGADPDALAPSICGGHEDAVTQLETALHVAVRMKQYSLASLLLQSGANPNLPILIMAAEDCDKVTSNALKEACKNRDASLVDLLIRFGARDDDCQALKLASSSNDFHLMSKLLSLRSHPDPEFKINKKAIELPGVYGAGGLMGSVTFSSMFPTTPVMINWHSLGCVENIRKNWLIDASLAHNIKLKLNVQNQTASLLAITRIDLSNNGLKKIPISLLQLPSLRILTLSQNKLECLPETGESDSPSSRVKGMKKSASYSVSLAGRCYNQWILPCLEEIHLQDNRLEAVSDSIFELPSLQLLDLSNNRLRCLPHSLWTAPKLRDVNVSLNLLRELPTRSFETSVRNLLTSSSSVDSDTSGQGTQKSSAVYEKEECKYSSDRVKSHPLHHHNFWSNEVSITIAPLLEEEKEEHQPCKLSTLNLSHNGFTSIPKILSCTASNLSRLNLSYNCLTSVGSVKSFPANLKHLDLSYNQIISWFRSEGDTMSELLCSNCVPRDETDKENGSPYRRCSKSPYCVHRQHTRLDNLRSLVLANNQLTSLSFLSETDNLDEFEQLDQIENRSRTFKLLFPNMTLLDASNNNIKDVPVNISDLSNLSVLHLNGNTQICRLPPEMGLLSKLWNLGLKGCNLNEPLKTMLESKKYKTMDIVGYLKSVLEDSKPYARMKLMVVGLQGIGKTSLLDQLRQEGFGSYRKKPPEHWSKRMGNKNIDLKTPKGVTLSTVGVDVCDWTYEKKVRGQPSFGPVTFRTWDFGGQKEYYSTHQYFLSKRSLYLVVWKMVDGEKAVEGIQQWLVNIQARAPNAPVIIVGTHYDLVKEYFPPFYSQELQQSIRDKFINIVDADKCGLPRVVDSIEVSTKTKYNIKNLCSLIYDTVFGIKCPGSKERLLEQKIPATYLALEDVIGHLASERRSEGKDPVLKTEEYKKQVVQEMQKRFRVSFRDAGELSQATSFLHENGVLLHYEDSTLKDLYFLDPQWLCDILAHVVTIREINPYARNGIMSSDDLKHLFKSSSCAPSDTKNYIINLLNKFEVALTWDSRTLLIPSLLPTERSLQSGYTACDVRIPVRSRGWGVRAPRSAESNPEADSTNKASLSIEERASKSIYRLLLMTYFPSGFWSRLMTRLVGDDTVIEIVRSFYKVPRELGSDPEVLSFLKQKAEWTCWQTGLSLKHLGHTIFRVKEVQPSIPCQPVDYWQPVKFLINFEGRWGDIELQKSSVLEIYIPNHLTVITKSNGEVITIHPNNEYVAKLLALTVDHIDTLLEDWYPSLGTRFVHTSEGKFLVTRIVPCVKCLNTQALGYNVIRHRVSEASPASPSSSHRGSLAAAPADSPSSSVCHFSDIGYESSGSSRKPSRDHLSTEDEDEEQLDDRSVYCFLVEECILKGSQEKRVKCPLHGDVSLKSLAPDTVFVDLGEHHLIKSENIRRGKMLGRGAFGFVFRATVRRGSHSVSEVAMKMLQPVDPGHGARKSDNMAYKLAWNKWERDPLQYSCKSYCTARQELNILLTLRHPHIVPLVGVCTKPLALILQLAPMGALDLLIKEYRRCGAQMNAFVIEKILLQVSKALEYLHQQHIIYRDLKSENVLVWKMYRPHEPVKINSVQVDVKLADYGISRSTLPTGTKGFGGTEGFMAPEIMRFNGEEEYTEKVDCFSFGMFIYELISLRLPFAGQESVKESILDGGRPLITPRDILYPSHILDLMVLCWSEAAKDRPATSQIVSIIGAPEFVHLMDVVSMSDSNAVVAATSVTNNASRSNQEVWLARLGKQTDILSASDFSWTDYHNLKPLSSLTITAICSVADTTIWLGDAHAMIHVYCIEKREEIANFRLDPTAENPTSVDQIVFSKYQDVVIILCTNGKLWSVDRFNYSVKEVNQDLDSVHCISLITKGVQSYELWVGQSNGVVSVIPQGSSSNIVTLDHYQDTDVPIMDKLDVRHMITNDEYVWTSMYLGCVVYQWNVSTQKVIHKLDCSKLAPCSESLMSICIEEHLTPGKGEITSLAVLKDELYIGTTWGCFIVAESASLRPVTVFRPHEHEIKSILAFEIPDRSVQVPQSSPSPPESEFDVSSREAPQMIRYVVTVGKGFRNLVSRYVQVSRDRRCATDPDEYYSVLWKSGHWIT